MGRLPRGSLGTFDNWAGAETVAAHESGWKVGIDAKIQGCGLDNLIQLDNEDYYKKG
jgi:hypothetical protein